MAWRGLSVAGAAGMLAARTALVMVGTGVTAIDAAIAFDPFLEVDHTDAIAACTLHAFNSRTHDIAPSVEKTPPDLRTDHSTKQRDPVVTLLCPHAGYNARILERARFKCDHALAFFLRAIHGFGRSSERTSTDRALKARKFLRRFFSKSGSFLLSVWRLAAGQVKVAGDGILAR